jgi:hypothetical protein
MVSDTRWNVRRLLLEHVVEQGQQHHRYDQDQGDGTPVVAKLVAGSAGWCWPVIRADSSRRAGRGMAPATPAAAAGGVVVTAPPPACWRMRVQEGFVEVVGAGGGLDRGGRVVGDQMAVADQQQPVAAVGLVHDVAGHQQCGASCRELPEAAATARPAAPGPARPWARRAPADRAG